MSIKEFIIKFKLLIIKMEWKNIAVYSIFQNKLPALIINWIKLIYYLDLSTKFSEYKKGVL